MINYLIQRPISVFMAFLAFFIVSIITYVNIPVSLLPDIAIPEITVQISGDNTSARELENTVVSRVRSQLLQVSKLRDIRSETRDGNAIIHLSFEYGANTDLAFIEVNEKIDAAMNYLPRETDRPRVIKASATDIPVFNLDLTLRSDKSFEPTDILRFIELSDFAETVIKRRFEQLPQVAMVDISGLVKKQVLIFPDRRTMDVSGISLSDIESALNSNNVEPGSMLVRDGYYEYVIRFSSVLRTVEDVQNIYIRKNDRIYQLKDLAKVEMTPEKEKGMVLYNGKRAVVLGVVKQSEENMANMQKAVDGVIEQFRKDYPAIEFNLSQNQTELLDYTIYNLKENLLLAFIFVFFVSVLFLKDGRSSFVIGISLFISLTISLLFFYLFGVSMNVVSLTGLILASGMMIDSSIVVTDNIGQYRQKGLALADACVVGTQEVIAPMLSSSLTTIAVFLPLIFLSGIAGALFFDQAFSVTVGLLVSYITGITFLPVLYKIVYSIQLPRFLQRKKQETDTDTRTDSLAEKLYDHGIAWVFSHKALIAFILIAVFPLCFWLFTLIPKEKMPDINQNELMLHIEWNENIHVMENQTRCLALSRALTSHAEEISGLIGAQQFLLNSERELTVTESEIYLRTQTARDIPGLKQAIETYFEQLHPGALITFAPAGTIFEKIFTTGEADLVVEFYTAGKHTSSDAETVHGLVERLAAVSGEKPVSASFQNQLNLRIDREKLLLYNLPYNAIYQALKTAFKENQFATLRSQQQYLPVILGEDEKTVGDILHYTLIDVSGNPDGSRNKVPLAAFVSVSPAEDLKTIVAGSAGEYLPFYFFDLKNSEKTVEKLRQEFGQDKDWDIGFSGSYFSNRQMIREMIVILFISLLLMYFILTAQFEDFKLPLIVLLEIPIDITFALALLMVTGHTLNLMSAIGIVVSTGIIINDSILKVDVMNQLRKSGMHLMEAIHEAGRRRLKAILMTSLTSMVCMAPLLFSNDLGSSLEKPLAIATIGGMLIGTPVSLFVVPLVYWAVFRKSEERRTNNE
jgi:multidrug efflux pump subunit AcrB